MSIYPNLFRPLPTFDELLNATALIVQEFDWKQVLLVTEEINIDTQVSRPNSSAKLLVCNGPNRSFLWQYSHAMN